MLKNNKKYAFFDVDETIISTKSMFGFIKSYFSYFQDDQLESKFYRTFEELKARNEKREDINRWFYSYFRHFPITQVEYACQRWYEAHANNTQAFYHDNIVKIIAQHQKNGVECVFVSGSFKELLQPIANELNIKHMLCINLERKGLHYTGEIIPPQTIGEGKATALQQFLTQQQADARDCYAYGDDISDAPMLAAVGNPIAVAGEPQLEKHAKQRGWKVINPYLSAA